MYLKAGELGCHTGYYNLGNFYRLGRDVKKDLKKARHYYELAALGGNLSARFFLGVLDSLDGEEERSLKHMMIGARAGDEDCLDVVKSWGLECGLVTEDEYADVHRAFKKQHDDRKSAAREEGVEIWVNNST